MLDKIAHQKLFFISLIGIVVTILILTTTFAYQSIRVNYSDGADSDLSISAGVLDVKYCRNDECVSPSESENNYNKINVDNLSFLPNYKTASYVEFVVDNTNSTDDVAYMITLSNLTYNKMFVSEAFKYTVVSVNDNGSLNEISTGDFSTLSGDSFELKLEDRIYKYIEKGKSEKVRIYLWLDENVEVQLDLTDESNRQFKGYVNVSSIFEGEIASPLLYRRLISSAKLASLNEDKIRTVYNDTFNLNNITGTSSENDRMLALAEDDYGTSYVYRGAVKDNYVNFAGFTWRIVRINGDGSIRLILDGSLDKVTHNGTSVYLNTKLKALDSDGKLPIKSSPYDDNAYVGYMFGDFETNSTGYDDAHENIKDSTIKTYVDAFYEEYLASYQNDYLADTLFCGDKTRGTGYTTLGFGTGDTNKTYYGAYDRLYNSSTLSTPTLECASSEIVADSSLTEEQLAYSRYTSIVDENTRTSKGVLINNSLKYPIGLLSADELVMAGAFKSKNNTSYYLYDAYGYETRMLYQIWWTMSPNSFYGKYASEFDSYISGSSLNDSYVYNAYGVRPVINLKAEILVDDGVGSYESPYTVKVS